MFLNNMENQKLFLTSSIPPSVNHYMASRAIVKHGKALSINYKTKDAVRYQQKFADYIASEVEHQGWTTNLGDKRHFYIDGDFYFERQHCDPNNYWKCLLDAITQTQLVWSDDDMVCERVNRIQFDKDNPRIELCIYHVDYVGVFDNDKQFCDFKNKNCIVCNRYKRNCSILNRAETGIIQPEITGMDCNKITRIKGE